MGDLSNPIKIGNFIEKGSGLQQKYSVANQNSTNRKHKNPPKPSALGD